MRTFHCLDHLIQVKHLDGDVIEMGVAKGNTTFTLAYFMEEATPNKKIYACDTYMGLPYGESEKLTKGRFAHCGDIFKETLQSAKLKNIEIVEGAIENTLTSLSDKVFCFAWLDMDLYASTSFGYKFLEDRMVPGGIIGFHDYQFVNCPGIEIVVDREVNYDKYEVISPLKNNSLFLRKK